MNPTALLLAGALALAAPVGYLTLDASAELPRLATSDPTVSAGDDAVSVAAVASTDNLVVRIHHDGDALEGTLAIDDAAQTLAILAGETVLGFAVDPAAEHLVALEFTDRDPLDLLGLATAHLSGDDVASYGECDLVEVLFQTYSTGRSTGLTVWGVECVPGPVRHVGIESSGAQVVVPYPTCPTSCSMGYGFGGSDRFVFDVPEGSARIDVVAHWDAESPMTESLEIWLTTPDEECGEGCWLAVAQGKGDGQVAFTYDAPEPGEYALSSFFTMPVGASVRQDVWLEAVVVPS